MRIKNPRRKTDKKKQNKKIPDDSRGKQKNEKSLRCEFITSSYKVV